MNRAFGADALYPQHRRNPKRCPRGRRLSKLVKAIEAEFRTAAATDEAVARDPLINAGKAYCVARCGGCRLTAGWSPPT